jgi:hypothetical protein
MKIVTDLVNKLTELQASLNQLVRAVEDEPTTTRRIS